MNAAIFIAGRELRERARLFLVATLLAVVPFIAAFTLREQRQAGVAVIASLLGIGYAIVVALMLGVSAIGRDLGEQRTSFLFSRPVSPAAIWLGKIAAALVLCAGGFFIVVLPTYSVAGVSWRDVWTPSENTALFMIVLCAVLFFGGHAGSTMVRSRSARIGADAFFFALTLVATAAMLRTLLRASAGDAAFWFIAVAGGALLLALIVAPLWQIAHGRTDAQRNHAVLSKGIWSVAAVVLAIAAVGVWYVTHAPLEKVTQVFAMDQSPSGSWVFVSGRAPGRGAAVQSYLIDTQTGTRERLTLPVLQGVQFSEDGRLAAWLESDSLFPPRAPSASDLRDYLEASSAMQGKGRYRLYTRRLERGAKKVATPVVVPLPMRIHLSADGTQLTTRGERVEVYEVATGRLLAANPLENQPVRVPGVVGEIGAAKVLLLTRDRKMQVADRATGKVEVEVSGLSTPIIGWMDTMPRKFAENAMFAGFDRDRHYVVWDSRTGARRPL